MVGFHAVPNADIYKIMTQEKKMSVAREAAKKSCSFRGPAIKRGGGTALVGHIITFFAASPSKHFYLVSIGVKYLCVYLLFFLIESLDIFKRYFCINVIMLLWSERRHFS